MYNLVDIHCHSNLSYDAFDNKERYIKFDINKIYSESNIKMICITDHNIFDYNKYLDFVKEFEKLKIKCLAGMELTIEGVHWIFIIDNIRLSKEKTGENFSKRLLNLVGLDIDNYTAKDFKSINFEASDIISLLNDLEINYIAIPHLDKDKGILKGGKVSTAKLDGFYNYIKNNIVYGFETKHHNEFFVKKLKGINKSIEILNGENEKKINSLYEQIKNLENMKKLKSAFIFGSDFHGEEDNYEKLENKLIYIKAECSFEGLRMSLIDYESRVFSKERLELYKKDTNKIIEKIVVDLNGEEQNILLGDGLNAIIGSRGTGKSFILKSLVQENTNYIGSDIYTQFKVKSVKLKGEIEKESLDKDIDVDYISQKNSGKTGNNNIYDLLSEAPYDTQKFVDNIKRFGTSIEKINKIDEYIKDLNTAIQSFIELKNKKEENIDYNFLNTYNNFYNSTNETFKMLEIFDKYINFCNTNISKIELEQKNLIDFNKNIENFEKSIEFATKIKGYKFNKFEQLKGLVNELKEANESKCLSNDKNIKRILDTKTLVENMKVSASKNISNETQFYNNSFKNLTTYVSNLFYLYEKANKNIKKIKEIEPSKIIDKELIDVNKSNLSVKLNIEYKLNIHGNKVNELKTVFTNYSSFSKNIMFEEIFDDFGKQYIDNIYPYKDGRITRGDYGGYDIHKPIIVPQISIEYNNEIRDLSKLSPGEKSDILLDLILDPNSPKILIIDQPEDDLDNETIFKKVVEKIRDIKLRRQVIIISHNANLVINGDSDIIIVCIKENNYYKVIYDSMESLKKHEYSSINTKLIKDTVLNIATQVLDGGRIALANRVKKIGYKDIFLKEENNEIDI